MEWQEVIDHPSLQDLPFKIETDEWGQIVMSPAVDAHGIYQSRMVRLLDRLAGEGRISTECAIETARGTKVADVAWRSTPFLKKHGTGNISLPESPEIVVEVKSPSNSVKYMKLKSSLFFEAGAKEVWFCDKDGHVRYFNPQGETERSELFGKFPDHIDIGVV
ncbi:MAG: Uma2 family endonuclease [Syntrophobacteraceae bacterium]